MGDSKFKRILSVFMVMMLLFQLKLITPLKSNAYNCLIYGIDVSSYQKDINWGAVASDSVDFAIIRTGTTNYNQETMITDQYFVQNYTGAKNNGLKVGAYYFTSAFTQSGMIKNAQDCLNTLNGRQLDYPIFIDIENPAKSTKQVALGKNTLTSYLFEALTVLRNAGYKAGVYSNKSFLESYVDVNRIKSAGYYIWMAQYPSGSYAVNPTDYDKSDNCSMWQYSSIGSVNGINGYCDVDVSYIDFSPNPVPKGDKYIVATESSNLNIRSSPSMGDNIIGKASKDAIVTVLEIVSNGSWAKIYYNGVTGYCSMTYLKKLNSEGTDLKQPYITTDKEYYTLGETVHISWEPSTSGSNLSHYWLIIDGPSGRLLNETMGLNTSYDFTLTEVGSYLIQTFATPKGSLEGEGSLTDSAQVYVEPTAPMITATTEEVTLNMDYSQSSTVHFTYRNVPEVIKSVNMSFSESKKGIVDLSWGEWEDKTIPLTMSGKSMGETDVTVLLKNADTGEVLDSITVHVIIKNTVTLSITQSYEYPENTFSNTSINMAEGEYTYAYLVLNGATSVGTIECSANDDSIVDIEWNGENYNNTTKKFIGFNVIPKKIGKEQIKFTYTIDGQIISTTYFEVEVYAECAVLNFYDKGKLIATMDAQPGDNFGKYINIIKHPIILGEPKFIGWYTDENGGEKYTDDMIIYSYDEISLYAHYDESSQKPQYLEGDANLDGKVNADDLVMLQNWLLGSGDLTCWQNVDLCKDNKIDVFDLCLFRKILIEN